MMETTGKIAPQSVIRPLAFFKERPNVRKQYGQDSLGELNASIQKHGQLQEVIALFDGQLISGYRRLYAARLGDIDALRAFLIEDELDAGRIHVMQGVENIQRDSLSEVEIWEMLVEHKRLFPAQMNKDIAAEYGKEACWVTRYLSPSKCVAEWQADFRAGRVGIASMYEVSKGSEHQQRELFSRRLTEGATRDQIEKAIRKARPKGTDAVSCSMVSIPLPSGARVVIKGKLTDLVDVVDCLTECVGAAKKGIKEKLSLKSFQSVLRDKSKEANDV